MSLTKRIEIDPFGHKKETLQDKESTSSSDNTQRTGHEAQFISIGVGIDRRQSLCENLSKFRRLCWRRCVLCVWYLPRDFEMCNPPRLPQPCQWSLCRCLVYGIHGLPRRAVSNGMRARALSKRRGIHRLRPQQPPMRPHRLQVRNVMLQRPLRRRSVRARLLRWGWK